MKVFFRPVALALPVGLAMLTGLAGGPASGQQAFDPAPTPAVQEAPKPEDPKKDDGKKEEAKKPEPQKPEAKKEEPKKDEPKAFDEVIKDTEKIEGLFTFYRSSKNELWLEVSPEMLNRPYFLEVTTTTGLGGFEGGATTGDPLYDVVFNLKRVREQVFLVVKQTNYRAKDGDPIATSLARSFSDSILAAFKVESAPHPVRKSVLVNAGPFFGGDVAAYGQFLSQALRTPFAVDPQKTYIDVVKSFPENSEIEVAYHFVAGKAAAVTTLADGRSAPVRMRYSIIQLKDSDYRPRLADPRVGYFTSAFRDLTQDDPVDPFTQYILRWNLEKKDPTAALSEPKKPIVFWLDNGVPHKYRKAVTSGLLLWNRAFEKIGFKDAVVVKQMPDGVEFDPFDIRYNVLRWATSPGDGYAVALFRANPLTGEILNASIRVDASIVGFTSEAYRLEDELKGFTGVAPEPDRKQAWRCDYSRHARTVAAFGATALDLLALQGNGVPASEREKYLEQFITMVIAHEMGHIVGLRHNFKASTMLPLKDLNNVEKTSKMGVLSSVMDYSPPNLAPPGVPQGHYYTTVIGPYDAWAIEYGYTPVPGANGTEEEKPHLAKIAARSTEPGHAYATDEDTADFGFAPYASDPVSSRFDMSADPLAFARQRAAMVQLLIKRLEERTPLPGRTYQDTRRKFSLLLGEYLRTFGVAAKYIGGISTSRALRDDANAPRAPYEVVPAARQREALAYLREALFEPQAFRFSPSLLNKLAIDKDWHWGVNPFEPMHLSINDVVQMRQRAILSWLFTPGLLARLRDNEARVRKPAETLTMADLFASMSDAIFAELRKPQAPAAIPTLRRDLQREYLEVLIRHYLGVGGAPADAQSLARMHLRTVSANITTALARQPGGMDTTTRAHLEHSQERIQRALKAQTVTPG